MANGKPPKPGLRYRLNELGMVSEAATGGSTQGKLRRQTAERALGRQKRIAVGLPALKKKS